MDLWQLIRSGHASILELCREIRAASGGGGLDRDRLFRQLGRELGRQLRSTEYVLFKEAESGTSAERTHAEIRRSLRELSNSRDKQSPGWTRRFEAFVEMLDQHFRLEEHALGAALGALAPAEADDLRRAFQREKIAAIQADRRHLPVALMPRRYSVSDALAMSVLAGVAAFAVIGVIWGTGFGRSGRSTANRKAGYSQGGSAPGGQFGSRP